MPDQNAVESLYLPFTIVIMGGAREEKKAESQLYLTLSEEKALEKYQGTAKEYLEAVTFLIGVKHTLKPLHTFAMLNLDPEYIHEICQHVEQIRQPVESFLEVAKKFKDGLGSEARQGRHRHV